MFLLQGHTNSVRSLAFSADGSLLASGSDDHSVRLWDARKGAPSARLADHKAAVFGVALSPDGQRLYSCSDDGRLLAWDLDPVGGRRELVICRRPLVALAVSPDGGLVAVGGDRSPRHPQDPALRVFDAATAKEIALSHFSEPARPVWSLAFAGQGRTLAIGQNNGMVRLWDGERNRMGLSLSHTVAVRAMAFSPDGALLVTAPGTPAFVWELAQSKVRHRFGEIRHAIESLAFAPDGTLATGCLDSTVRLWDTYTGQEKARFDWKLGRIHAVAIAPDGMTAAAGGENGDIVIWDVDL